MKKIDIFIRSICITGNPEFGYFCSTTQHKTLKEAILSLSNKVVVVDPSHSLYPSRQRQFGQLKYSRTKNKKDIYTDGTYEFVAYVDRVKEV